MSQSFFTRPLINLVLHADSKNGLFCLASDKQQVQGLAFFRVFFTVLRLDRTVFGQNLKAETFVLFVFSYRQHGKVI